MIALKIVLILLALCCSAWAKPDSSDSAVESIVVPSASHSVSMMAPAAVIAEPSVGVAHIPAQVGTAISKTVHYAETPVINGYTSTLYKPELSNLDTPFKFNINQRYYRPVKTIIPKFMAVEPKAHVEMPIVTSLKEVEIHPPILPEVRVANPIYYPPVIAPLIR